MKTKRGVYGIVALFFLFFVSLVARAEVNLTIQTELKTKAIDYAGLPTNIFTNQPLSGIQYRIQKRSYDRTWRALDGSWVTWKTGHANENGRIVSRRDIPAQNRKIRIQIRFVSDDLRIVKFGYIQNKWLTIATSTENLADKNGAYTINYGERVFHHQLADSSSEASALENPSRSNLYNDEQYLRSLLFFYGQKYARYYDTISSIDFPQVSLIYPLDTAKDAIPFAPPADVEGLIHRFAAMDPIGLVIRSVIPDFDVYFPKQYMADNFTTHFDHVNEEITFFNYDYYIHSFPEAMQEMTRSEFNLFMIHRKLARLMAHEINHVWYGQMVPGRLPLVQPHGAESPASIAFFEAIGLLMEEYWYLPFTSSDFFEHQPNYKKDIYSHLYEDSESTTPPTVTIEDFNLLSRGSYLILNRLINGEKTFEYDYSAGDVLHAQALSDERSGEDDAVSRSYSSLIFLLPLADDNPNHPRRLGLTCPAHLSFSVESILRIIAHWGSTGLWTMAEENSTLRFLELLEEGGYIRPETRRMVHQFTDPSLPNDIHLFCKAVDRFASDKIPESLLDDDSYRSETVVRTPEESFERVSLEERRLELIREIAELTEQIHRLSLSQTRVLTLINQIQNPEIKTILKNLLITYKKCPLLDENQIKNLFDLGQPITLLQLTEIRRKILEDQEHLDESFRFESLSGDAYSACELNSIYDHTSPIREEQLDLRTRFLPEYNHYRTQADSKRELRDRLRQELLEVESLLRH